MNEIIKSRIRPLVLPWLHRWQWFHDHSRWKLREYRERHRILGSATIVLKDVHGIRFVLYPFDRSNVLTLVRRSYDVAEFQAIPRLVQPGDIALDVGANVGVYSVLLSRLCGPIGRVWAFEPVPDTYWRLRETLALNRCDNVIPVQTAICEKDDTVRMNLFERQFSEWNTLGMPSMQAPDGTRVSPSQSINVQARTLDQFCDASGIDRINFLKVDVEGFEVAVFQGAERLLKEHRVDYICFEISKEPLKGAGVESRNVFQALNANGYQAYRFDPTVGGFKGPIQDSSEESWTNFFASWRDLTMLKETAEHVRCDQNMQKRTR
jgi:FkbM family methyltransferase